MTFCAVTIQDHGKDGLLRLTVGPYGENPHYALLAVDAIPKLCKVLTDYASSGGAKRKPPKVAIDVDDIDIDDLI